MRFLDAVLPAANLSAERRLGGWPGQGRQSRPHPASRAKNPPDWRAQSWA